MNDTKKGLKFMTLALFTASISMLGLFALGFEHYMRGELDEVGSLIIGFAGVGLVLSFFTFIFLLIGIKSFRGDMDKHGKEHKENVHKATWLMFLGSVCFIVFIILLFLYAAGPKIVADTAQEVVREIKNIILLMQISSIISTVLFSFMAVFLVIDIVPKELKKSLWIPAGVNIISVLTGFSIFLSILLRYEIVAAAPRLETSHYLTQGFSFVGYSLFAVLYLKTYLRFRKKKTLRRKKEHISDKQKIESSSESSQEDDDQYEG